MRGVRVHWWRVEWDGLTRKKGNGCDATRCRCVDRQDIHRVWSTVQCSAYLPIHTFTFFSFFGRNKGGIQGQVAGCGVGFYQTGIECRTAEEKLGSRPARVSSYIAFARFYFILLGFAAGGGESAGE